MNQEEIIGFEALYASMLKCKKGVMWKGSAAHFVLNGPEMVYKLSHQLKDGTYKPRAPSKFTIYSPKKRDIVSISFRDRVYQIVHQACQLIFYRYYLHLSVLDL